MKLIKIISSLLLIFALGCSEATTSVDLSTEQKPASQNYLSLDMEIFSTSQIVFTTSTAPIFLNVGDTAQFDMWSNPAILTAKLALTYNLTNICIFSITITDRFTNSTALTYTVKLVGNDILNFSAENFHLTPNYSHRITLILNYRGAQ